MLTARDENLKKLEESDIQTRNRGVAYPHHFMLVHDRLRGRMRRWSRAVALLCMVYLLALLLFHHHLEPRHDRAGDIVDGHDSNNAPAPLAAPANSSVRSRDLRHQLQDLEEGMTRLEKEIFNVKAKLAEEALARKHLLQAVKEQERFSMQQQRESQEPALNQKQAGRHDWLQHEISQLQEADLRGMHEQSFQFLQDMGREFKEQQRWGSRRPQIDVFHVPFGNAIVHQTYQPEAVAEEDYNASSLLKVGNGLAVYSAYHDDRLNETWVRMVVVLSASKDARRMVCHFDMADSGATYNTEAEQYEMCENHKKKYLGFIYSCRLPVKVKDVSGYKLHVSRFDTPDMRIPLPVLPVSPPGLGHGKALPDAPLTANYKYNFSVCVSPLFGSVSANRLIEFIELTRLLGVQHVHFYDYHVSSTVQRILQYYEGKGWVSVSPWRLPPFMVPHKIWYQGQLISNNDCLYRTMATSAYTAFHDIDEFIVPHRENARTLNDVIPLVLPNDTCGFSFKSAFYDPGVATSFQDDLMTVALTAKSEMISKVRTKVMVSPQRVFEVGIHHVSKQLLEPWLARPFNPQVALLHHYRECIRDFGMRCDNWVKDTIIQDRYMPELRERTLSTQRVLGL